MYPNKVIIKGYKFSYECFEVSLEKAIHYKEVSPKLIFYMVLYLRTFRLTNNSYLWKKYLKLEFEISFKLFYFTLETAIDESNRWPRVIWFNKVNKQLSYEAESICKELSGELWW